MYPAKLGLRKSAGGVTSSSDRCRGCHAPVFSSVIEGESVRMRHETCLPVGSRCVDCHGAAAHQPDTHRPLAPSMGDCSRCHDDVTASSDCVTCHLSGSSVTRTDVALTPWRITHGAQWELTHGMGELDSCRACHPAGYCAKCHFDQPHPSGWPTDHGRIARDTKSIQSACLNCHIREYCDSCHLIEMPHPADWRPRHLEETQGKNDERCRRCHGAADCALCHELHTHPGRVDLGARR